MKTYPTLGAAIRDRRNHLKITAGELAQAAGVNITTIYQWEGGKQHPHSSSLVNLAAALQWSAHELMAHADIGLRSEAVQEVNRATLPPGIAADLATQQDVTVWILGHGRVNGAPAKGSDDEFRALVITPGADRDTVTLEWAISLIDTHHGFATVDESAALASLKEHNPAWLVVTFRDILITPDLE